MDMNDYIVAAVIIVIIGIGIYKIVAKKKDESGATRRAGNGDRKNRQ